MIADYGSAETVWNGEKAAMQHLGYKVVFDPTFPVTQTDFTQNVIAMRQAGVARFSSSSRCRRTMRRP